MGHPSACDGPTLWPGLVRDFLVRRARRSAQQHGGAVPRVEADERLKQSSHERRVRVLAAQNGDVNSASALLAYWQWCSLRMGNPPKMDAVIIEYLEWARQRYRKDPKRNIAKALGLVRPTRGAPQVLMRKNKAKGPDVKATPDALAEAVMMYQALRRDPDPKTHVHKNAVEAVVAATGVSRPVLLKAMAKHRPKKSRPKSESDSGDSGTKTVTIDELPALFQDERAGELMMLDGDRLAAMVAAAGGPSYSGDDATELCVGWLIKHTDSQK
jgi:hypothetical protein